MSKLSSSYRTRERERETKKHNETRMERETEAGQEGHEYLEEESR